MNRRRFVSTGLGAWAGHFLESSPVACQNLKGSVSRRLNKLPQNDSHYKEVKSYVEEVPVSEYYYASDQAYEDFRDIKYGVRIHWGVYSNWEVDPSWPFLRMPNEKKLQYEQLYTTWNPQSFSADEWMNLFAENGLRMFAFTTKHHDGFSMFDTKTRVKQRANWMASGGPKLEACDLAYGIMETPFKRDVVKELCDAAHKRGIKVDLYFSHPDWYDADFRPCCYHPLQVPSSAELTVFFDKVKDMLGERMVVVPDPTALETRRMLERHRAQLTELLTNYGTVDMMCLDMWLAPAVWPQLRETILSLRKIQPNVMLRARGIGNYGDYYTPEGFVPASKENTNMPWFVIYPLAANSMAYDPISQHYKGAGWIIRNLVDSVAKGGNFMVGIGPDGSGQFHPTAVAQLKEAGAWLRVNGEGIYATRPREGALWAEGDDLRYSRTKDQRFIYAFSLKWPGEVLVLKTVKAREGSEVRMLGLDKPLKWRNDPERGLMIEIPATLQDESNRPCRFAYAFKIEGHNL